MTVDAQAASLAELQQTMARPSSDMSAGAWCEAFNEAVLLAVSLAARLEAAETALRRIEAGETVPGGAGVIRSSSAKIAREYLLAAGRGTHGCSESTR